VVKSEQDLAPALQRALEQRPEPDSSFARRPSTASLILNDERRARTLPRWRLRTARAATTMGAAVVLGGWALTTGASYSLVSHFVHMKPVTGVQTTRPEVGVLVDAPSDQVPALASTLASQGIQVSFTVDRAPSASQLGVQLLGDQVVPRLPTGGLVRWLGTRGQLHRMGFRRHFLYASQGPSVGQWWMAHRAGGRLIAGALRLDHGDSVGPLRPGEVVELNVSSTTDLQTLVAELRQRLDEQHLAAVPVGRLMRDAGSTA
jgi:hypothetical protein